MEGPDFFFVDPPLKVKFSEPLYLGLSGIQ